MWVVGIDPGLTGGLVCVSNVVNNLRTGTDVVSFLDMPIRTFPNSKAKFVDGAEVLEFLQFTKPDRIVVELVATRPGQGVSSSGQFMNAFGGVVAACFASGCQDITLVAPPVWKRKFGLIGTAKDAARMKVREIWPHGADIAFKRKKDSGRADAALIALYGLDYVAATQKTRRRKAA